MEATVKRLRFAWSLDSCEKGKIESSGQEALLNENIEQCTFMQTEDYPLMECFCNVSDSGDGQACLSLAKFWEPRSGRSNMRMDLFNSHQRDPLFPLEEEAGDLTESDNIE